MPHQTINDFDSVLKTCSSFCCVLCVCVGTDDCAPVPTAANSRCDADSTIESQHQTRAQHADCSTVNKSLLCQKTRASGTFLSP